MKVVHYKGLDRNFGDDLNEVIWSRFFADLLSREDDDLLLGIGTIFSQTYLPPSRVAGKRVFVLGSGAGLAALPENWPNSEWQVLAVRGPLSSRVVGVHAAATDAAALLAALPELVPRTGMRKRPIFMPHLGSMPGSRWAAVASQTGIELVDPRWPTDRILEAFGHASLAICEAMHGAIVADTLRVPWIPIVISPRIFPFKWFDWSWSLGLDYCPLRIPPSSAWEALRHFKLKAHKRDLYFDLPRGESRSVVEAMLLADFESRFGKGARPMPAIRETRTRAIVRRTARLLDPIFIDRAATQLSRAAQSTPYLSDERVFGEQLDKLQSATERLRVLAR